MKESVKANVNTPPQKNKENPEVTENSRKYSEVQEQNRQRSIRLT